MGVYVSREDERQGLYSNGLWVDFTPTAWKQAEALNDKYVLLEGTFDVEHRGHMGLWSGAIRDIDRAIAWR